MLRLEWDSAAGRLRGFRRRPGFRAFFAAVGPDIGDLRELRHDEPTAVRGEKGP